MLTTPENFELKLNGGVCSGTVSLELHSLKIVFSSNTKPIIVTRTRDFLRVFCSRFRGKAKEAKGVRALIEFTIFT